MDRAERRQQLKDLFAQASELPASERTGFLDRECPEELRAEVEELLAFDEPEGFLEPESESALELPVALDAAMPDRLGRYRILREIGSGGMGRVFEAEQERPRRHVALKVMHTLLQGSEAARRFELEAEWLGRLEHPGIARIYEAGVDDETSVPFLAMELIRGEHLLEYAERELDDRGRLELLVRVAEAIAHAHHKGVIHRDLKPSNVLVTADGQPKVLDFGVARAAEATDLQATRVGQVVGTVTHMSPEQAAGRPEDVDTRTDVYALGVIAFELLSGGEQPHDTTELDLPAALRKIVEEPARRVDRFAPRLRGDVATIVHKALEKRLEDRYPSVDAFAEDIRRYLRGEAIAARPASSWYLLKRFAARNRVIVTAVGIAVLSLIVGIAIAVDQAIDAERSALAEREARFRAERRLGDVRDFATRAVFEIHDEIQYLKGATEARRMLMNLGHDALERLRVEEIEDPDLLRAVAEAFVKQGRLRGGDAFHLGGVAAGDCFAEGVRLWRLAVQEPGIESRPRDRARLGLALYHYALHALESRAFDVAEARLREAAEVMRPAVEEHPEIQDLPGDLGVVLTRLGRVLMSRGRTDEALSLFEEGIALNGESLRRAQTEEDRAYQTRGLLVSHNWLGNYFRDRGELDRALEEYTLYRDYAQRLHDGDPDNVVDQANLAIAHIKLAKIATRRDQLSVSAEELQRAFALLRPLIPESPVPGVPTNFRRVFNVVDAALQSADVRYKQGDVLDALSRLDSITDWVGELREQSGSNAGWAWVCEEHRIHRIRALASAGRFEDLGDLVSESESALSARLESDPSLRVLRAATDLAASRFEIAWHRRDLDAAQQAAGDMQERSARLLSIDESPGSRARQLGASLFVAASTSPESRSGRLDAARGFSRQQSVPEAARTLITRYEAALDRWRR